MSSATLKNMQVGQTERFHFAAFAQDNAHSPSTTPDDTTVFNCTGGGGFVHVTPVPGDLRAFDVQAISPGSGQLFVDEQVSPFLTPLNRLVLNFTVVAPPPDTRRVDFVSADDPA